jgi:hypothetical protein
MIQIMGGRQKLATIAVFLDMVTITRVAIWKNVQGAAGS